MVCHSFYSPNLLCLLNFHAQLARSTNPADAAICGDVRQLRHTKDFETLNNFFGDDEPGQYQPAGSTASNYAYGFTPIAVGDLEVEMVEPPDIPNFMLAEINSGMLHH